MKIVGIVCDRHVVDGMLMHTVNDEYITAIRDGAGALPLLIPSTDLALDTGALLRAVDGLLFTGAPSNVAPRHYGQAPRPGTELDEVRDATTLPLLRAAIDTGKPLLAICRGFQELNVALGGSSTSMSMKSPAGSITANRPACRATPNMRRPIR
jgi:putative glutamine amidotransferase